ncbi:MAG: hypothetical protein MJ103_08705 [Saccharofermentans sp.]|nr:hypothetical protein [Saccharofermentans sp.]
MILSQPSEEQFKEWMKIWQEYAPSLKPNRRGGIEVARYILKKYKTEEIKDAVKAGQYAMAIMMNSHQRAKLPEGGEPDPKIFKILNEGPGVTLYENKDEIFKDVQDIVVTIDITSGIYSVEGSSLLWDELCAYQGLDQDDLDNPVSVAEYVECMKKFGKMK